MNLEIDSRFLIGLRVELASVRFWLRKCRMRPPHTANARLASLPLGSINPYNNCSILYLNPFWRPAVVPVMLVYTQPTTTVLAKSYADTIRRHTTHVIILVRLAIYTLIWLFHEAILFWGGSIIIYEKADICGGGIYGLPDTFRVADFVIGLLEIGGGGTFTLFDGCLDR